MKSELKFFLAGVVAVIIVGGVFALNKDKEVNPTGSVSQANEYMATSTAANAVYGALTTDKLLKTGQGALGSVVITGANTGIMNFYNATTSNVLARTNNIATSTILMASIPASAAAGTYTFDVAFTTGLLLELESGNMATATVTFR